MSINIRIRGRHLATAGASALIFASGAAAQGIGNNGNASNNGAGNATANPSASANGSVNGNAGAVQGQPMQGTSGGSANGGSANGGSVNGGQSLVGVSALVDNPGAYFGQNVTTAGVVGKVVGPRTFTLKGEDAIQRNSGQNEIMVVLTGPLPDVPGRGDANRLRPGDPVQITGSFQNYKRLHGDGSGGATDGVGYQGVPMVVANQISIAGIDNANSNGSGGNGSGGNGGGGASANGGGNGASANGASGASLNSAPSNGAGNANANGNGNANTNGNANANANTNANGPVALSQLIDNPAQFLGQKVTIAGVVGKIEGPRSITVYGEDAIQHGPSGPNRLRVILATPIPDVPGRPDDARLKPGDPIQLTGTYENLRTLTGGHAGGKVGYQGAPTLVATQIGIAALQSHGDLGVGSQR